MENILDITQQDVQDSSIISYQYYEFNPQIGNSLNTPGEIVIQVYPQDEYFHPAESFLLFEGAIVKADGNAIGKTDAVTFTNNGMLYLFRLIQYQLNGTEIESIYSPGQATTIKKLLKNTKDSPGLLSCWEKDTSVLLTATDNDGFKIRKAYTSVDPVPPGTFSFIVRLSDIFGFAEDYNKVIYGMRQTIRLVRKGDDDALLRNATSATTDLKVNLEKISFVTAIVKPDDEHKMKLYNTIKSKELINLRFHEHCLETIQLPVSREVTWKLGVRNTRPRYIIFALQTDKGEDQTKNSSLFDHCKLTNLYVTLNSQRYPEVDYDMDFAKMKFARIYQDTMTFFNDYYSVDPIITGPQLSPVEYHKLYPIFAIDLTKQPERIKEPIIDVTLKAFFKENVAANTHAFALIISEKLIKLQSDGEKFNIVY